MRPSPTTASLPSLTVNDPLRPPGRGGPPATWQLVVRHPGRLHVGHLQELVVEARVSGGAAPADAPGREPVLVRPSLPGAVVTPVESALDPAQGVVRAAFQVAPVVLGPLPGAGVEVWRHGQCLQKIDTPMQSLGHGPVYALAALTAAVTALLLALGQTAFLSGGAAERLVRGLWPQVLPGVEAAAPAAQTLAEWTTVAASRGEVTIGVILALLTVTALVARSRRDGRGLETVGPFPSLGPPRKAELPPFLSRVDPDELEQIHRSHPRFGKEPPA